MEGVITDPIGDTHSPVRDCIIVTFGLDDVDDDVLNVELANTYGGSYRRNDDEHLLQKMTKNAVG